MKKKKIILCLLIGAVVSLASVSVLAYQATGKDKIETVYKEVAVEKGNLTVGVTESGSVTIGTLEQELSIESTSSGTTGSAQSGASQGMTGTASNTSSGSSAETLEVE